MRIVQFERIQLQETLLPVRSHGPTFPGIFRLSLSILSSSLQGLVLSLTTFSRRTAFAPSDF
jgi:hypothetical protein